MKVKGQILICTAIMLNDHSNPYIESTTVLSDNNCSDPVGISMYVQTIASIKRTQNKFNECTSRQSSFEGP